MKIRYLEFIILELIKWVKNGELPIEGEVISDKELIEIRLNSNFKIDSNLCHIRLFRIYTQITNSSLFVLPVKYNPKKNTFDFLVVGYNTNTPELSEIFEQLVFLEDIKPNMVMRTVIFADTISDYNTNFLYRNYVDKLENLFIQNVLDLHIIENEKKLNLKLSRMTFDGEL